MELINLRSLNLMAEESGDIIKFLAQRRGIIYNNNNINNNNNNNNNDDDFIENVRDLFNTLNYEPILIKAGYDNNYLEYRSEGYNSLSFEEYLDLIKPHLNDLIYIHKNKGEWKIQLTTQINFTSLRPSSDETRVMHTRSVNEEFMNGSNTEKLLKRYLNLFYKNTKKIYKKK